MDPDSSSTPSTHGANLNSDPNASLLSAAGIARFRTTTDGAIIDANDAFTALVGIDHSDLLETPFSRLVVEDEALIALTRAEGNPASTTLSVRAAAGTPGQYQPEAASALRDTEPPAYVSVVGKPRTYETEDGTVNVSLRPENITVVDDATRDRWVVETAERTLDRIEAYGEWEAEQEAPESGSTAPTNEYAEMVRDRGEVGDDAEFLVGFVDVHVGVHAESVVGSGR